MADHQAKPLLTYNSDNWKTILEDLISEKVDTLFKVNMVITGSEKLLDDVMPFL